MKDFLGHTINIGDAIVTIQTGYRDFQKGTVTAFTAQYVKFVDRGGNESRRSPEDVIIVTDLKTKAPKNIKK